MLETSVALARTLTVPRGVWIGSAVLGKVFLRSGKDKEAEVAFNIAVATIESIVAALKTDVLVRSFLAAPPVLEVFQMLGRRPPTIEPSSPSLTVKAQ